MPIYLYTAVYLVESIDANISLYNSLYNAVKGLCDVVGNYVAGMLRFMYDMDVKVGR